VLRAAGRAPRTVNGRRDPIESAYHDGDEVVLKAKRNTSSTACAQPARFIEPNRRDAQAFLPDFGGAWVIAAMGGAADIALMRARWSSTGAGRHRYPLLRLKGHYLALATLGLNISFYIVASNWIGLNSARLARKRCLRA